jgi:hypothetical protein
MCTALTQEISLPGWRCTTLGCASLDPSGGRSCRSGSGDATGAVGQRTARRVTQRGERRGGCWLLRLTLIGLAIVRDPSFLQGTRASAERAHAD